jgi:hypothetical protein
LQKTGWGISNLGAAPQVKAVGTSQSAQKEL